MLMGQRRSGIFGAPMQGATPPYFPQPQPEPDAPAAMPKQGVNWMGVLADALAGAAGQPGPFAALAERRRSEQMQITQEQRQRAGRFADWRAQEQWKRDNPMPAHNDTTADYDFITQKLGREAADQYLRSIGDPMVTVQLPGNRVYTGPRSGMAAAMGAGQGAPPTAPVGKLTPIGGATSSASPTFR